MGGYQINPSLHSLAHLWGKGCRGLLGNSFVKVHPYEGANGDESLYVFHLRGRIAGNRLPVNIRITEFNIRRDE